ncbi:MAG TPA: autotransporter-associated beta strand repeat-containing protein [Chthoniobacteraceae bacterium]|nr:autotransporter-associated beta strand repeat-containing protein [Chthoniobacteraceae bacterium]
MNDATSILQVGGGEAVANTYNGKVTVLLGVGSTGSNSEDLVVQLNKAAGTTAITGDLEINGGTVRNMFNDQIASTSNLVINQGQYDANGKNETIASVTMRGGNFRTSSAAAGGSTVTVTGDFEITGADDLTGSGDGVAANSNTTLTIGGTLRMNGYAKGTIGATNSVMNVGGLEMTGTTLTFNASGNALMRLHGDVTTFASSTMARLGNNTTTSSLQLNGTRTFTVADGTAGIDLSVSTAVVDSAAPVAVGSFIKAGPGILQLEGAAQVNAYTGTTAVNEGSLVLFKSVGVNAIPAGALTFGDGLGGANAGKVIVRNSNQIADANNVTIASSGLLDLFTFNTSEQVNSLSGSGNVELGPGSTLTVSGVPSTSFSAASPARAA